MSINIATLTRHPERLGKTLMSCAVCSHAILTTSPHGYCSSLRTSTCSTTPPSTRSCVGPPSISPSASAFRPGHRRSPLPVAGRSGRRARSRQGRISRTGRPLRATAPPRSSTAFLTSSERRARRRSRSRRTSPSSSASRPPPTPSTTASTLRSRRRSPPGDPPTQGPGTHRRSSSTRRKVKFSTKTKPRFV